MICVVNLDDNSEKEFSAEALAASSLQNVWLELVDPSAEELAVVADKTGIPKNFLRLRKTETAVNLRLEPDFTVITFVVLHDFFSPKEFHQILMVFTKGCLVTISRKSDEKIMRVVKERMSKTKVDPPAQVTFFIIDEIVSGHFVQLQQLEQVTSSLEEEVVEKTDPGTLKKIFTLKSKLISLNKMLWYERGLIFNLHRCGETCMPARARSLFDTTHEDLTRQIDIVETYREILSDAINVHLSATSNKINLSIKALTIVIFYLTIITTLTSFPNTVATFFGISQFGNTNSIIVVLAIILSTILPLIWLWRSKWLRPNL